MKHDDVKDVKKDKKMVAGAVHKHEKKLHPGKPLTKLAKGGKTNADMGTYGRNMAKVINQKNSSGRGR
jgi:hypothetical protein